MIGVGVDIIAVQRIADLLERHGSRFVDRCFSPREIELCDARGRARAAAYAARWAAKEAFMKALGRATTGILARDIEVWRSDSGCPRLCLHGSAAAVYAEVGGAALHLSLSHERDFAVATVVIE